VITTLFEVLGNCHSVSAMSERQRTLSFYG
jgi:hypothetical protein